MNIKTIVLATAVMSIPNTLLAKAASKTISLVDYVNTLQGTNSNFGLSHGNTFPATAMPFAQHMWTPQTGPNGEGFKYLYSADLYELQ